MTDDDLIPAPSGTLPTDPAPANDEHHDVVIAAGQAQLTLSSALDELTRSFLRVEAVAMALARQLDGGAR